MARHRGDHARVPGEGAWSCFEGQEPECTVCGMPILPVVFAAGVPDGGYPADWAAETATSPSFPLALTVTVSVPVLVTTVVWAETAEAEPTLLEAVTWTRRVAPTSALTNM